MSRDQVNLINSRVTLELKEKCPRWDSNPHCPLFESGLSNQLEYWGLRKEGEAPPLASPPYRS